MEIRKFTKYLKVLYISYKIRNICAKIYKISVSNKIYSHIFQLFFSMVKKHLDIKRIRTEHRLTQSALSKLTGYPQGFISQMENMRDATPDAFVNKVVDVLGITNIDDYIREVDFKDLNVKNVSRSSIGHGAQYNDNAMADRLLTLLEKKDEQINNLTNETIRLKEEILRLKEQLFQLKN